jgi:hypothetical protein
MRRLCWMLTSHRALHNTHLASRSRSSLDSVEASRHACRTRSSVMNV